ncbi:hypothetical protein OIU76_012652 [Salix suchowensis]|nr:hypothetical protein OIU76_012652 [Salix suchowensis]KAJ6358073.1 hypothetical protein OIU78_005826 [Salix suchowensis]
MASFYPEMALNGIRPKTLSTGTLHLKNGVRCMAEVCCRIAVHPVKISG